MSDTTSASRGAHPARAAEERRGPPDSGSTDAVSIVATLCAQQRYREALHAASAALRLEPGNGRLWSAGAGAAFALGLVADAEQFWKAAMAHDPGCVEAYSNLGALSARRGELGAAERYLTEAVSLDPDHADALSNLGALRVELERHEEALRPLERSLVLKGDNPLALNNLGLALINLGRIDEAHSSLQRAIALKPDLADALVNIAHLHLLKGDRDAAMRDLDLALSADPGNARAHMIKAEQTRATSPCPWSAQLAQAYRQRGARPPREVIQLDFAMGKLCEDLGRHDDAFEAYAEGNRLHYARHPFDEASAQSHFEETLREFRAELYPDAAEEGSSPAAQLGSRVPVFIVGMPRSGTTLVEQILATHPEVFGAGELTVIPDLLESVPGVPPRARRAAWLGHLRALGDQYLAKAWRPCAREKFLIDKLPGNYRHLGLLPLMIPKAKIIHMNRDPLDACFSCFATQFAKGHEYSYDQGTLGRHYLRYHRLMEHWREVMPAGSILDVRYEEVVADLESATRRILAFIGLDWHESCTRFHQNPRIVETASRAQVKQPIYSRSIGRWRRFETHLAPLKHELASILAPNVTQLSVSPASALAVQVLSGQSDT